MARRPGEIQVPGFSLAAAAEAWSLETRQSLLDQQLMLSRPLYGGRHHLKAVLGNPHTGEEQLQTLRRVVEASLP